MTTVSPMLLLPNNGGREKGGGSGNIVQFVTTMTVGREKEKGREGRGDDKVHVALHLAAAPEGNERNKDRPLYQVLKTGRRKREKKKGKKKKGKKNKSQIKLSNGRTPRKAGG